MDFTFRRRAVASLTSRVGVYILADLDNMPLYVGQSTDGIRARVARHLTSARSDIIANRQIDVWEIAYVWEYPVEQISEIKALETRLIHHFNPRSQLINGTLPATPLDPSPPPDPARVVQVMSAEEIEDRIQPEQRLPRQASHYAQIVGHFLTVKNSRQIARAMDAHFERLKKYHARLLGQAEPDADDGRDT